MTADWQCSGMQKKHQTFIKIIHNIMRGVAVAHYSSNQRREIATSCAFAYKGTDGCNGHLDLLDNTELTTSLFIEGVFKFIAIFNTIINVSGASCTVQWQPQ